MRRVGSLRHFRAALLPLLLVPVLGGAYRFIADPRPWWKIELLGLLNGALLASLVVLPGAAFLVRGWTSGRHWLSAVGVIWTMTCWTRAILSGSSALAFFAVAMTAYWWALGFHLKRWASRIELNSGLSWYQGPRRNPSGAYVQSENGQRFEVAMLDAAGLFVFGPPGSVQTLGSTPLRFVWSQIEVPMEVEVVTVIEREQQWGYGLRIAQTSAEAAQSFLRALETMRVRGYA